MPVSTNNITGSADACTGVRCAEADFFTLEDMHRNSFPLPLEGQRIRVERELSHDFEPYACERSSGMFLQRFLVKLVDPRAATLDEAILRFDGVDELADLSGQTFDYIEASSFIPGIDAPSSLWVLRNTAGQLVFAYGALAVERPLTDKLPEITWQLVDVGCPFAPSLDPMAAELSPVAVRARDQSGDDVQLSTEQTAPFPVGCDKGHLRMLYAAKYRGDGITGGGTLPDQFIFFVARDALFKNEL